MDKLNPCPFCGSIDLEVSNTHTPSYWVECHECDAKAHGASFNYTTKQHNDFHSKPLPRPYVLARKSAIAAWNRRTPTPLAEAREAVVEVVKLWRADRGYERYELLMAALDRLAAAEKSEGR